MEKNNYNFRKYSYICIALFHWVNEGITYDYKISFDNEKNTCNRRFRFYP